MTDIVKDMMGNSFTFTRGPRRIVSVVPSQTEYLYDLGLEEEVVGITKFCIHPKEWHQRKTRVGGTKTLHLETIQKLHPDLIIANKEENVAEQIAALQKVAPVWVSDIHTLEDALQMMQTLGTITNKESRAEEIIEKIKETFMQLPLTHIAGKRAAYFIWYRPWMVVAQHTFIQDILQKIGFQNVFADEERYPETTLQHLQQLQPEYSFFSSEPFPFRQEHINEVAEALPETECIFVDGEMFSWYGSRLLQSVAYFQKIFSKK